MKMMRTALVTSSLVLSLLLGLNAASAGVMSPELEQSLRLEVDDLGQTIQDIDQILRATEKGKVSPEAAAAHREAATQYKDAKALIEARKYEEGYQKLRAAKKSVMVAARELFEKGVGAPVDKIVARHVEVGASRVKAVAELLKGKSTPEATAAYKEGERLYQEAKAQYTAGQHRDAYRTLDESILKLDEAIRILWKEKGPRAKGAKAKGA